MASAVERPGAAQWVPADADIPVLREAAQQCRGCELWEDATQVVFGEGQTPARMMLVGEQPGDQEDRRGEPFIGPAGRVLDDALERAGIPRERVYVTNAVKHFRFEERGKRRIHATPQAGHIAACRPWLAAEVAAVHPEVVVCLGATAARAVFGRPVKIGETRGRLLEHAGRTVVVTVHPSSLLRLPDDADPVAAYAAFDADLVVARAALLGDGAPS